VETRRRHPIGCCSIFVGLGMWFLDPALLLYLHIYIHIYVLLDEATMLFQRFWP